MRRTPTLLTVAFFGAGGALSVRTLAAIAERHRLLLVVEPLTRRTSLVARMKGALRDAAHDLLGRGGDMSRTASAQGAAHVRARGRRDERLAHHLRRLQPDIICIAGYPWILPRDVFSCARLGAINLHTSLLPKHRGPMPLYWVYAHDDRETGVTVHWVDDGADTGDIIAQERFPLGRGENIVHLHESSADRGAALMVAAVDAVERGAAARTRQNEDLATSDGMARPGSSIVDFAWDVERIWHVLAGLHPLFREPLKDAAGQPIRYQGVLGFEARSHAELPGSVTVESGCYILHCRGGVVRLGMRAPTA